jgi:hypothetical protein
MTRVQNIFNSPHILKGCIIHPKRVQSTWLSVVDVYSCLTCVSSIVGPAGPAGSRGAPGRIGVGGEFSFSEITWYTS